MTETEIKVAWEGTAAEARALIERQGYTLSGERTLETDQLFDITSRGLERSGLLLRLRRITSPGGSKQAIVTYKGLATREVYKSREEIEFEVSDPDAFTLVLDRLGYHPVFRYEKYRATFRARGVPGLITVDETPIGIYMELEGPRDWIDSTARLLVLPPDRFLTLSYGDLYRNYREKHPDAPADMTYPLEEPYSSAGK